MRRRTLFLLILWTVLACAGLAQQLARSYFSHVVLSSTPSGLLPAPRLARRLVIVLFDGLRYDTAFRHDVMPNLNALATQGASGMALTTDVTMTGIGVRTIGTGVTADLLDIVRNWDNRPVEFDSVFSLAHAAGLRIAFIGDSPWIQLFGRFAEMKYTVPDLGIADIDQSDPRVWQAGLLALRSRRFDIVVVHFVGTDHAGHRYRSDSPQYRAKAHQLDGFLADAWAIVSRRPDTVLCVLADHGSAPNGNHGSDEPDARRTPFVLVGAGIARARGLSISQLDWAATFCALLGLPYPAPSEGRIAVEALSLPDAARATLLRANLADRLAYLRAYAGRTGSMDEPNGAVLAAVDAARARGDYALAMTLSTRALRDLEAAYTRSVYARPLYSLLWIAILGLTVVLLLLCARASSDPPPMVTLLLAIGLPVLVTHATTAAAHAAFSLGLTALAATAVLVLLRTRGGPPGRPLAIVVVLATAWEAGVVVLFVGAHKVPHAAWWALGAIGVTVAAGAILYAGAILRKAARQPALATVIVLALTFGLPPRGEIPACLVLVVLLEVRTAAGAASQADSGWTWTRARAFTPLLMLIAIAIPYAIAWRRLGWQESRFRLPGPHALTSTPVVAASGAVLAGLWLILLYRASSGPRRVYIAAATVLVAVALVAVLGPETGQGATTTSLLVNTSLYGSATLATVVLLAPAAGLAERGPALAAAAFAALIVLSRGAQLALLPAALLLAERLLAGRAAHDGAGGHDLASAVRLAAALVLLRLLIFGFTEGRFYFSAIDVRVAFVGDQNARELARPIVIMFLRFFLPFVVLVVAGLRGVSARTRGRVILFALAFLAVRLVHLASVYRLALHHFWIPYTLVGEIAFFLAFVFSLAAASGLASLADRGSGGARGLHHECIEPGPEIASSALGGACAALALGYPAVNGGK